MPMRNTKRLSRRFLSVHWDRCHKADEKSKTNTVSLNFLAIKPLWEICRSLEISVSWRQLRSAPSSSPEAETWGCSSQAASSKLPGARSTRTHDDFESAGGKQTGPHSHPKAASRACNFIPHLVLMEVNGHWGNQLSNVSKHTSEGVLKDREGLVPGQEQKSLLQDYQDQSCW